MNFCFFQFELDDDDEEFVVKSAAVKPTSLLPSKYACQAEDSVFAVTDCSGNFHGEAFVLVSKLDGIVPTVQVIQILLARITSLLLT